VVIVEGVVIPSDIIAISVERKDSRRVQVIRSINPIVIDDVVVAFQVKVPSNRLADLHVSDDSVIGVEAEAVRSERETAEGSHILSGLPPLLSAGH